MDQRVTPSPAATSVLTDDYDSLTYFMGFDWAKQKHQVALVDRQGQILFNESLENNAAGWQWLREKLVAYPSVAVCIETNCGADVERLLEMNLRVYPINPKAAERYRERAKPSGAKTDALDALAMAHALRTDGRNMRPLRPLDPLTGELRILCRDEIALIGQRTGLVLQLEATLHQYYPAVLEAFDDLTCPSVWALIIRFPNPAALQIAGKRSWNTFLHTHKLFRAETSQKRLEIFARANAFACPNPALVAAKQRLAVALCRQLQTLQAQLNAYRERITEIFNSHPDHDIFRSLPGAGAKLAPRLLAELGNDRAVFDSPEALQLYAGTAPVTRQSGNYSFQRMRRACNKYLRTAIHLWAQFSINHCAWAQTYYQQKIREGKKHNAALRCLGHRWLKILWHMWRKQTPYDEALHMRHQVKHGKWTIALQPAQTPGNTSPGN